MELCKFRGSIALVGQEVDHAAQIILQSATCLEHQNQGYAPAEVPYHLTLVTKSELRSLASPLEVVLEGLRKSMADDIPKVHYLGLGGASHAGETALFIVCIWAKGQQLRRLLGLPPKHFHVTLSAQDVHDVDKGLSSLFTADYDRITSPDLLDHLVFTLFAFQDYFRAKTFAVQLCNLHESSEKGFLRLGDVALKTEEYKLAMLAFSCAFERATSPQTKEYCLQKLLASAKETEWGTIFANTEVQQVPDDLFVVLTKPWSPELRTRISGADSKPTMRRDPRDQLYIPMPQLPLSPLSLYKIPRYFSWLVPFRVALMSIPRSAADIAALASSHIGIRRVVTLTEERPLPSAWFPERLGIKNTFLPVPDHNPLSIEQIDLIMQLLHDEDNLPILIHCAGGKGRTGVVAACYLTAFGFSSTPTDGVLSEPTMSATEAIKALRAVRPISVETDQQEACVARWCSAVWKRRCIFPEPALEPPPYSLEVEGKLNSDSNLFLFVGLPGAGKSWTARALLARNPTGWCRVSQDEAGSRATCENEVGRFGGKGSLILDRCNTSRDDRKQWLALAAHWSKAPICVSFEYDRELCASRAQSRADHPTLPPGNRVRSAIEQMHNTYVQPSLKEGFSAIIHIRSFAAAWEFVERVSTPVSLLKFPRTEHLLNLGAATSDDLMSTISPTNLALRPDERLVITEKVDGANMGFSLSADKTRILVQNRSHYVNSKSHEQFKKLDLWVDSHREALYRLLDRDPVFSQRYILYGEWMAATHSVSYSDLPDWFLAFDLYDRTTDIFIDRSTLEGLLAQSDIHLVPLLYEGTILEDVEIKMRQMVQKKSHFCDDLVEGIYVKVESAGKVVRRGKIVRGDFIAGNEHWTRGEIRLNKLRRVQDDD